MIKLELLSSMFSMFLSRCEVGFPSSNNAISVVEFRCGAMCQSWFLGCNCLLINCRYHCYGTVSFIKNLALKHLKSVKSFTLSVFTMIILRVFSSLLSGQQFEGPCKRMWQGFLKQKKPPWGRSRKITKESKDQGKSKI